MGKVIDETGNKYGRLTVLYRVKNDKKNQAVWHCKCECGKECDVTGVHLRSGKTKSCGCLQKESVIELNKTKRKQEIKKGDRFGFLTILDEPLIGKFFCQCDCGNQVLLKRSDLIMGNNTRCGFQCSIPKKAHNFIDETGNRYGKLTVIKRAENKLNRSEAYWECLCDCGNTVIVVGTSLRSGNTQSCGCIKSKGERKIENILIEHNINFQREYSFENLYINNGLAKFDFAIFDNDNNLLKLVEYQGIQHFNNSDFGKLQRENSDPKKREYCQKNNIPLIEIPYTDYDKLDWEYLKEKCNL